MRAIVKHAVRLVIDVLSKTNHEGPRRSNFFVILGSSCSWIFVLPIALSRIRARRPRPARRPRHKRRRRFNVGSVCEGRETRSPALMAESAATMTACSSFSAVTSRPDVFDVGMTVVLRRTCDRNRRRTARERAG